VLNRADQKKIIAVIVIQVLSGFLDLLAVALIGILGALAVSGVESSQPGNRVSTALRILHLSDNNLQTQAGILGISAALILIGRTVLSIIFTRRALFFLSRRGARLSAELSSRLFAQSLLKIQEKSIQDTLYALTNGVTTVTLGVLGSSVIVISDFALMIVIGTGLFLIDPAIAISTLLLFSLIAFVMHRLMSVRAHNLGTLNAAQTIKSNEKIVEVLSSYRELVVRNRRDYYVAEIGKSRMKVADTLAEIQFMPNVSKYVIETTVVLGAILISGYQFLFNDATHAVATLSVFLAAGTRIAPAIMRIQSGVIQIKSNIGAAGPTLDLIETLGTMESKAYTPKDLSFSHIGFESKVAIDHVSFKYPSQPQKAISDLCLVIEPGMSVALVGPSGAGKTTLVDLILGVVPLDSGSVTISSRSPLDAIQEWPGAISYVPQDVVITNGTILENIALGYPVEEIKIDAIWRAIESAQLTAFVNNLPDGIYTQVGERGTRISGGQRQRLGIARAMYTKPLLLVLDEATSSLDGATESDFTEAIRILKGSVTVIMIAHRLSTVRELDLVVYLEDGKILASGKFEEVRTKVTDFDHQAKIMGL
jgi:ABC-type multidrug transport system fused ATPase/permease subunit